MPDGPEPPKKRMSEFVSVVLKNYIKEVMPNEQQGKAYGCTGTG